MVRKQAIATGRAPAPIGPALVGIAFFGFSSGLMQKAADTMCCLLCALSGMVLQAIPGMTLAAMRWLESCVLGHGWWLFCLHLLGNLAPLMSWLAGAI